MPDYHVAQILSHKSICKYFFSLIRGNIPLRARRQILYF